MEIRRVEDSFLRIKKKGFIDTHCTKIFSSMGLHRQCNGNRIKSFLSFHLSDFFFYTSSINGRLMIYWSNRKTRQCLANTSKTRSIQERRFIIERHSHIREVIPFTSTILSLEEK